MVWPLFSLSSIIESGKLFNNKVTAFVADSASIYILKATPRSFLIKYATQNTRTIIIHVEASPTIASPTVILVVTNLIKQFNAK
jgi:hypothetical protein